MSDNNLYRQVKKFADDKTDTPILISGVLGVTIGGKKTVEVPNRDGFVWVKLRGSQSELIQVYNTTVSPIYGLPVLVTRQNNRYSIYGRDLNQYQDWGNSSYLPKHGTQHSFAPELGLGGDITWVYGRQIIPLLSMPSGTDGAPNLIINPLTYKNANGGWNYIGDEATADVTVAKPTTADARLMLLYWDTELGTSGFITGTFFAATITGTSAITPFIPDLTGNTKIPISAVRLVSGSTNITWDNIYDVRQFATPSNPLGISVWDEGIPQGTGTVLDFTGAGIQATISGSVVNVNVTATGGGGGGGIGVWTSGSAGAYSITTIDGVNQSLGNQALSHGFDNVATGTYSHAEGGGTLAKGASSHAEGSQTKALGDASHSEGLTTNAVGDYSHAEGRITLASGTYSHAEGQQTDAVGNSAHAEGFDNVAAGTASHAEGGLNSVSGTYSHVEGYNNRVTGGEASHAAGFSNQVSGNYSSVVTGRNHSLNANYSAILAGSGITGSADNTAYADFMNIKSLASGTAVSNVGIDAQGFLVTGTTGGGGGSTDGWNSYNAVIPTRASADDPTYVLTFAAVDLTGIISPGMRIKWTQNSTVRYGIVTAISYSTNTTLTLYGGTDYDVLDTATYTISEFNYSTVKAPYAFPLDPLKWTVTTTNTNRCQKTSPTLGTWYGDTGLSSTGPNISIPIGAWDVSYSALIDEMDTSTTEYNVWSTLSTTSSSESDSEFTTLVVLTAPSGTYKIWNTVYIKKHLLLSSKTTYYLNIQSTASGATPDNIDIRGDVIPTTIKAVSAYL